jgi:hypothetical protein
MRAQEFIPERKKKKSSRSTGGYFFPGYGYYGSGESGEGGGDGGGESVNRGMAEGLESLDDLTAAYQHHVELSRKYRKKGNREKDQHHTTQAFNIIQQIWEHPDYKLEFTDDPHSSQKNDALSMKHDSRFNEQGVAEGATVTRIDSKPVTDFVSGLKAYKHTDDWSQSGLDTGDDSYWKNKNLKTNTTKGLFAGDPRRTALYATGNAHETRYVEFTQNGQPIVYFDQKDLPAMRSRKTYLTVFDAGDFRQLPTGEWFSENPSKPIKQMPIGDPFKYIASQGWIVRVTDDLGKVFKQVKNMHKAGKIAHYGAEGMNESKQGVAEGSGDTIYPNAEVIKSKNGKPVGEIYQDGNSWGAFHYRADRGYDLIDSREEAIEALRELHQETGRSGPDYTIKGVAENFADGRNPQDKGDAKRHGINTKASVSSLRKTAKQGGRKGQLAHWLANMKSGRAKKK